MLSELLSGSSARPITVVDLTGESDADTGTENDESDVEREESSDGEANHSSSFTGSYIEQYGNYQHKMHIREERMRAHHERMKAHHERMKAHHERMKAHNERMEVFDGQWIERDDIGQIAENARPREINIAYGPGENLHKLQYSKSRVPEEYPPNDAPESMKKVYSQKIVGQVRLRLKNGWFDYIDLENRFENDKWIKTGQKKEVVLKLNDSPLLLSVGDHFQCEYLMRGYGAKCRFLSTYYKLWRFQTDTGTHEHKIWES